MANDRNASLLRRAATGFEAHPGLPLQEIADRRADCGNPRCSRAWLTFLKDRRRPVFEGRWGCCIKCVGALVNTAIRRESAEGGAIEDESRHRHRIPLGLILLAQGRITHPQLRHALDLQRQAGCDRIGQWLMRECGLSQDHITRALSVQWGCPVLPMEGFDPPAMALVMPRLLLDTLGIVPLRIAGRRVLYLAFTDELDASAAFAIERMSGLKVESGLLDPAQWTQARQRLSACSVVDATFKQVADTASLSSRIASDLTGMQPRASRLVRLHQFYWLRMWLETGAMSTRDGGVPAAMEDVADRIYSVSAKQ